MHCSARNFFSRFKELERSREIYDFFRVFSCPLVAEKKVYEFLSEFREKRPVASSGERGGRSRKVPKVLSQAINEKQNFFLFFVGTTTSPGLISSRGLLKGHKR